jgi:glycosyltransferase involved in cell wall biosynthesis
MATAVQQIITNPAVREELIQKGRKRFADFSIEKMAQQTLTVYESIAS